MKRENTLLTKTIPKPLPMIGTVNYGLHLGKQNKLLIIMEKFFKTKFINGKLTLGLKITRAPILTMTMAKLQVISYYGITEHFFTNEEMNLMTMESKLYTSTE